MKHDNFNQQRGVALFIAIFALLLLSAIALGMMYMANSETDINANYRVSQQLYNGAWAGINEARSRLTKAPGAGVAGDPAYIPAPTQLPTPGVNTLPVLPPGGSGVVYIFNPSGLPGDNIQPESTASRSFDDELCHENFTNFAGWTSPQGVPCPAPPFGGGWYYQVPGGSTSPLTGTAQALPYKWARITLKANNSASPDGVNYLVNAGTANNIPICWDGTKEVPMPANYVTCNDDPPPQQPGPLPGTYMKSVYMVTSLAVASNSNARRMMQTEIALTPPLITNAAIDTNDFVNTSGSSLTVNGYDNCNCICPIAVGGAAPNCTDRTTGAPCTGNTWAIYTSKTATSSGNPAIVAGQNPPTAQNQPFPYNVDGLINNYKTQPGAVNVALPPPPGPPPTPPVGAVSWQGNGWNCAVQTQQGYDAYGWNFTQPAPGGPAPACLPDSNHGYGWTCAAGTCTAGGTTFGAQPSPWPPADPSNVWPSPPVACQASSCPDQVTYIPGNVSLPSHATGSGVLIVDGNLTINGGISFDGLILVKGVITFAGGGAGQQDNILGGLLSGQGSIADQLKGSYNIQFDRCALQRQANKTKPPTILVAREVAY